MKAVQGAIGDTDVSLRKASDGSNTFAAAIERAASRALYTVPIWMALRTTVKAVTDTIAAGAQEIIDLDKATSRAGMFGGFEDATKFSAQFKTNIEGLRDSLGLG